ncbi:MAG TPA: methyl-accepting chemotaxis protein [Burkholderiaceae bacterium]|jgi:methyl-accepting chemotaxis protein WspA
MKDLSVKQRIAASFLLVIAVMSATSGLFYLHALANEARAEHVETYDLTGMAGAMELRTLLNDHILETYRVVFEAQTMHNKLVDVKARRARFELLDDELERSYAAYLPTVTDGADHEATARFKTALDAYRALHPRLLVLLDQAAIAEANVFANEELRPAWFACRQALLKMMTVNEGLIEEAMHGIRKTATQNKLIVLVACSVAIALSLGCGLLLYRSISRPLDATLAAIRLLGSGDLSGRLSLQRGDEFDAIERGFNNMVSSLRSLVAQAQRSAEQLTTSISEIAATARQQQATVTETAASTMQIGNTSTEIASTSRELVRTMGEISGKAEQTAMLAGSGQLGVARIGEVMRQLTAAAATVSDKLTLLSQKTGDANQMVTGIARVAEQAERLSRSVSQRAELAEKAAADDSGRGFALMATEVRRLADQSSSGAENIGRKLREIQSSAAEGAAGMERFADEVRRGNTEMMQVSVQLQKIIHQILALAPRVQSASEGMRAQSAGAVQIDQALDQLSETTRQTALALTHANTAIQNVDKVAKDLRGGVASFKI